MAIRATQQTIIGGGLPTTSAPAVAAVNGWRVYYDQTLDQLMLSVNAGPFSPIGTGLGAAGWTDDGTVVRLTTSTDVVSIGQNAPPANRKLFVTAASVLGSVGVEAAISGQGNGAIGRSTAWTRNGALAANNVIVGDSVTMGRNAGDPASSVIVGYNAVVPGSPGSAQAVAYSASGGWDATMQVTDGDLRLRTQQTLAGAAHDIDVVTATAVAASGNNGGFLNVNLGNANGLATGVGGSLIITPGNNPDDPGSFAQGTVTILASSDTMVPLQVVPTATHDAATPIFVTATPAFGLGFSVLPSGDVQIAPAAGPTWSIQDGSGNLMVSVTDPAELSFYGVATVARQTITGAPVDPVLVDLLAALEALGLIIDSTT